MVFHRCSVLFYRQQEVYQILWYCCTAYISHNFKIVNVLLRFELCYPYVKGYPDFVFLKNKPMLLARWDSPFTHFFKSDLNLFWQSFSCLTIGNGNALSAKYFAYWFDSFKCVTYVDQRPTWTKQRALRYICQNDFRERYFPFRTTCCCRLLWRQGWLNFVSSFRNV